MDWKRHLAILALLGCLGGLVQAVLISRATVPSLDAVRFVRLAAAIDQHGLLAALRQQREQPAFPVSVWLVHEGLIHLAGDFRTAWTTSVQLAAAIPLVLAVVPVYFLSRRLWGRRAAMLGTFLFCLLPEVVRLGADGLSDGLHLFWFAMAAWAAVEFFAAPDRGVHAGPRPLWLLVAGLATAVAALTRAEVLVLPVAIGLAGAGLILRPAEGCRRTRLVGGAACYALGLGLVLLPYLASMNALAAGPAVDRLLGRHEVEQPNTAVVQAATAMTAITADAWRLAGGEPMSFDRKDHGTSTRRRGVAAASVGFAGELADAFGYWIGALAVVGLLGRRPTRREHVFAALLAGLFAVAAFRFAASEGYLGARHLLVLVVLGIGAAGRGGLMFRERLPRALRRLDRRLPTRPLPSLAAGGLAVVLAAGYVTLVVGPLHTSRGPHRQAGQWLAEQRPTAGIVIDTRGWSGLYSGWPTHPYCDAGPRFFDPRLAYVVVERGELDGNGRRSRTLRELLAAGGQPAAEFAGPRPAEPNRQAVVVYRWNGKRFRDGIMAQGHQQGDRYVQLRAHVRGDGGRGI